MKTRIYNKLISLIIISSLSLFSATNAQATAGDDISNKATLGYKVSTVAQTVIESSSTGNNVPGVGNGSNTVFKEDRLINFTVANVATSKVVPNTTKQAVSYTIKNEGNSVQDFIFKALNNADATIDPHGGSADIFQPTNLKVFVESGATAGYQVAEDTAIFIDEMAVNTTQTVYIVSDIPLNRSNGTTVLINDDVAVMTLVAQAADGGTASAEGSAITNDDNGHVSPGGSGFSNAATTVTAGTSSDIADVTTSMQTVFGEAAGTQNGVGSNDIASNAQHSVNSSYIIESAELTVTKTSATLWDPVNKNTNPKSIPGAYVRYTITIANKTGAANADLTTLADILVSSLQLDPDFTDGTVANNPTTGVGLSFSVTHVDNAVTKTCTGDAADGDGDGCKYSGGAGGTLEVDIATLMGAADSQLAGGESLTIIFNVMVQ